MSETHLVEVYRAANSVDAHLLKNELEAAGLRAMVTDEIAATYYPGIWWTSPRIFMDEAEAARAAELIAELGK